MSLCPVKSSKGEPPPVGVRLLVDVREPRRRSCSGLPVPGCVPARGHHPLDWRQDNPATAASLQLWRVAPASVPAALVCGERPEGGEQREGVCVSEPWSSWNKDEPKRGVLYVEENLLQLSEGLDKRAPLLLWWGCWDHAPSDDTEGGRCHG